MKLRYLLLSVLITIHVCHAQNGPGGVGLKTGGTMVLWLDASTIAGIASDNNITQWSDLSSYANHAIQNNGNEKPNLIANQLNGRPAVSFNGVTENLKGTLLVPTNSPLTVFGVGYFNQLNQGVDDNEYVFCLGTGGSAGNQLSIGRRQSNGGTNTNQYYSWDGTATHFGPAISGQAWHLFTQVHRTAAPYHNWYLDGAMAVVDDYTTNLNTDGSYCIGDFYNSINDDFKLNGYVAELIVFNEELIVAKQNIVQSYLAAKYGLPVASDKFSGDDVVNGNNDFDVIGIGKESDGEHIESTAAGLHMVRSAGFDNGDYLVAGHHVETNSVNTADIAEAGSTLAARWDRAWWFDVTDTGTAMEATLTFNLYDAGLGGSLSGNASDYYLIFRAGGSGNWTLVSNSGFVSDKQISFNSIAVAGDGYYTLATSDLIASPVGVERLVSLSNGPGGVGDQFASSDLVMWLQASNISGANDDFVLRIADQSGFGHDAVQTATSNIPRLRTSVVNGNNVVRFDGTNDFYDANFGATVNAPLTLIGVNYFANVNQPSGDDDYLYTLGIDGGGANQQVALSRRRGNDATNPNKYFSRNGGTAANFFGPTITGQSWNIFTQTFDTSAPFHTLHLNGNSSAVTDYPGALASNGNFRIGNYTSGSLYLNGDLGEIIMFDRKLNTAERNIVHSYLGAKYNLTVGGDKYTGDDAGKGNYDYHVAGVGTEADGSNLSASASGIYMEQSANFANGDYVLFGDDGTTNTLNKSDIADASSLLQARWSRIWYFDVTDDATPVAVNVSFDFSEAGISIFPGGDPANYKLLFRSGTSGNWTLLAAGVGVQGDVVSFTNAVLTSDGYYALGTIDNLTSPLPIQLSAFNAQPAARSVILTWATQTEIENDYFEIEKASDVNAFESIGTVQGSGNSDDLKRYEFVDDAPYTGLIYYRLRQVDYNGNVAYSAIKAVLYEGPTQIDIFPNPASDYVHIRSNAPDRRHEITLMHVTGEPVTSITGQHGGDFTIATKGMAAGVYLLRIDVDGEVYFEKMVIN